MIETLIPGLSELVLLRAVMALLIAFAVSVAFGRTMIAWLSRQQVGQPIREEGPKSHYQKQGTPTMGGVLILASMILATLLCADWSSTYIWVLLGVTLVYGGIGYYDDYKKLVLKHSDGLASRWKFALQSLAALGVGVYLYSVAEVPAQTELWIPYLGWSLPLGMAFIAWTWFIVTGFSNAVNLTDGLDGLAIVPTALVGGALGLIAYLVGTDAPVMSPLVPGTLELVVLAGALVGAGLGFLWFNAHPAEVFMGDVGSLALGAILGTMAVMLRQEVLLAIMGGVFVMETVSVMLQVASFKSRGKRIFRMTPIHHHFELSGWPEPKVIVRFWILTALFVVLGMASL